MSDKESEEGCMSEALLDEYKEAAWISGWVQAYRDLWGIFATANPDADAALAARLAASEFRANRLATALAFVQWDKNENVCPACGAWRWTKTGRVGKHRKGCAIGEALAVKADPDAGRIVGSITYYDEVVPETSAEEHDAWLAKAGARMRKDT